MGLFGKSKKAKDESADYSQLGPGAHAVGPLPVATPVPDYPQKEIQKEQMSKASKGGHQPTIAQVQVVHAQPQKAVVHQQEQHRRQVQQSNLLSLSDPSLTRDPMMIRMCPSCQQESRTRIRTYPTWQTWTAGGVLLFVFWPICWIPLVLDSAKQTDHFCVLCGTQVGQVAPFQDCCVTNQS